MAKEMNRTSGTAKRKTPNSVVKANQRTAAMGRLAKKAAVEKEKNPQGLSYGFDPFGGALSMALPFGKVFSAAKALRGAGKIAQATGLEARLGAKVAGKTFGGTGKRSAGLGKPMDRAIDMGGRARDASEGVFPRLPGASNLPRGSARTFDQYADPLLEGAGRFKGKDDLSAFVSDAAVLGGMRKVAKAASKRRGGR
jgi:hypothetical protein